MGKLRSFIRKRLIWAVQYAVREEMKNYTFRQNSISSYTAQENKLEEIEEKIVQRLDKQIEKWTWERFLRTQKAIEGWTWKSSHEIGCQIDTMQTDVEMLLDKRLRDGIDDFVKKSNSYDETKKFDKLIERWTWDRYKRSEDKLLHTYMLWDYLADIQFHQKKVPFRKGEKIRIVFLYQIASFWPSWELLFEAMKEDNRFNVELVLLDETAREAFQMVTAEEFLKKKNINYTLFEDFELEEFNPHIVVIQTPYDEWHRKREHWSASFKSKGYRIIYIPYGIEISDTEDSHYMHFCQHVIVNSWRVYTFSDLMKRDYRKYSYNREAVRALGLPRFDALFYKERFELDDELKQRIAGRKVILWKVHFPKIITENTKEVFVTPDVNEYLRFANKIPEYKDFFFIFMPHPRFKAPVKDEELQYLIGELADMVEKMENVYVDTKDDYRNSLMNADYIITDRSAVMVEAAAVHVPVLFMYNSEYYEPVTKAVEELVNSYYQGSKYEDMVQFMDMAGRGRDYKKEERETAFRNCIPFFDGKCSARLMDDIEKGMSEEF